MQVFFDVVVGIEIGEEIDDVGCFVIVVVQQVELQLLGIGIVIFLCIYQFVLLLFVLVQFGVDLLVVVLGFGGIYQQVGVVFDYVFVVIVGDVIEGLVDCQQVVGWIEDYDVFVGCFEYCCGQLLLFFQVFVCVDVVVCVEYLCYLFLWVVSYGLVMIFQLVLVVFLVVYVVFYLVQFVVFFEMFGEGVMDVWQVVGVDVFDQFVIVFGIVFGVVEDCFEIGMLDLVVFQVLVL